MIDPEVKEQILDFFEDRKVPIALAALVGISALFNFDSIKASYQSFAEYRDANISLAAQNRMMKTTQRASKRSAEIARQRFENGCIPVASPHNKAIPIAPTEGATLVDNETGEPFPEGTVVCYITGHTAVLRKTDDGSMPIISEIAFTGELEPVKKVFGADLVQRYRVGVSPKLSPDSKPETQGSEDSDPTKALW